MQGSLGVKKETPLNIAVLYIWLNFTNSLPFDLCLFVDVRMRKPVGNEKCTERIVFTKGKYKTHLPHFPFFFLHTAATHSDMFQLVICFANNIIFVFVLGTRLFWWRPCSFFHSKIIKVKRGHVLNGLIRGHDGQLRVTLLKKRTASEQRWLEMGHIIKRHVGASHSLSFSRYWKEEWGLNDKVAPLATDVLITFCLKPHSSPK